MSNALSSTNRPHLARQARMEGSRTEQHVLLAPEGVLVLNQTGATILGLCDGERTVVEIVEELRGKYNRVDGDEVRISSPDSSPNGWWSLAMNRPYGMLAELTYACPLHCPYCSNPLNLTDYREELSTAEWQRC